MLHALTVASWDCCGAAVPTTGAHRLAFVREVYLSVLLCALRESQIRILKCLWCNQRFSVTLHAWCSYKHRPADHLCQ